MEYRLSVELEGHFDVVRSWPNFRPSLLALVTSSVSVFHAKYTDHDCLLLEYVR